MNQQAVPDDLLALARSGDRTALASVLALSQPNIRRYARRSCRNASDVDDAVQETMIVVYRRIGSLRALGAFASWLFTLVDRICLRMTRKMAGAPSLLDEIEEEAPLHGRTDSAIRLDLAAAIESLPLAYREVLLLRDVEELTIDEIAARLAATRPTVKARLHRARRLVREYLAI